MIKKNVLLLFALFPTLCACGQSSEPGSAPRERDTSRGAADTTADAATLQRSPSPERAAVSFITPLDGAVVSSPFRVEFSAAGMQVVPAGTEVPGSGHHHLLVDTELPDLDLPVPADDHHIHFGDGSSATELSLPPGEHTLQLLFADYLHVPHDEPVYSEPISITVE